MAAEKLYKWLNFTALGMRLFVTTMPTGDKRLVMMGGNKYPAQMKRLGFNLLGGLWLRRDIKIDFAMVRREFPDTPGSPRVFSQDMKRGDIVRVMRDKLAPTTEEVEAKIALTKALPLGLNYLGQEVFEGNEGRFIRQQQKAVVRESDNMHSLFLRAVTEDDLELCADGLVASLMEGRIYRTEDVNRFAEIIYGKPTPEKTPEMSKLHTAISHALARRMLTEKADTLDDKFSLALKLHEGLPPVNSEHVEKVVTMPMGVIAQVLIGEVAIQNGSIIRMPNIGNGAFLSTIRGATIQNINGEDNHTLAELSGNSFTQLSKTIKHDVALENIAYQKLDKEISVDGLKLSRSDHLEIIESLNNRNDIGRSVFSFRAPAKHGEIDEDTTRLISWISARYLIDGLAQMDSHLFGRGGEIGNRFMLAVGNRGSRLYAAEKNVKSIYDYNGLQAWSDEVVVARDNTHASKKRAIEENALQTPYIPSSQITEPKAMIPRNLAGPTREALSRIESKFGNIDAWVAKELGYKEDSLGQWLDAEQVDAVAMAIDAQMRGRGFIEADQTGLGKGRVLAAMARWAIMNGQKVIFVTEKPNLFSDFFRDLTHTDSAHLVNHLCLNQGVNIRLEGVKIHGASKKEDIEAMINSTTIPDDINMVMATYSQFNREAGDKDNMAKKATWLPHAAANAFLILDESHNAAGTSSNTGINVSFAVARTKNVIYSSATYAKSAKNFSVYAKVMPDSLKSADIGAILASGGEPLMEVFSSNLVRDGVLIRREHDMTELQFFNEVDNSRRELNEDLANKAANIFEVMGLLCGEVDKFVNDKNKLIKSATKNSIKSGAGRANKRNGFLPANFGARLFGLQRQTLLSMNVNFAADKAIQALNEGRKPCIVLENTMESLLKDAIAKRDEFLQDGVDQDDEYEDLEASEAESFTAIEAELYTGGTRVLDQPITFRDVLLKSLERMCIIKLVTPTSTISERVEIESVKKFKATIELMIDAFPDMPASPIDILRERIEQAGYSCGELSGRSIGLAYNDDGSQTVIAITGTSDKIAVIDRFNSGVMDAIVLTTAGSTGISLHASETFLDQRQRELIELQIPNDVATRMQFYGRVNRKGQVCPPIIRTLAVGLPSEIRLLSMQNIKMRGLSANTTSNQNSNNLSVDIPDLLNEVGSDICRKYMMQNLDIPKRLSIPLSKLSDDYAKKAPETWYADQLTGRLGLLTVQDQLDVYEEITENFNAEIAEMESRGINPFKTSEYDIGAKVTSRKILQGATGADSVFDEPVYITKIEYKEVIEAVTVEQIKERIASSIETIKEDPRVNVNDFGLFNGLIRILEHTQDERLSRALSGEFKTVNEALASEGNNIVKSIRNKINIVKESLLNIKPGVTVEFSNALGEHEGIIVRMQMPTLGKEHLLGEYDIVIATPGELNTYTTLNGFLNMSGKVTYGQNSTLLKKFREVLPGEVLRKRTLLDGNMFMAANKSLKEGFGSSVVYTDDLGTRQRGVLLPSTIKVDNIINQSNQEKIGLGQSFAADIITNSLSNGATFTNSKYEYSQQPLVINRINDLQFILHLSTTGPTGMMLLTNKNILAMMPGYEKKDGFAIGLVLENKIKYLVEEIYKAGFMLYAPNELQPIVEAKLQAFKNKSGPSI